MFVVTNDGRKVEGLEKTILFEDLAASDQLSAQVASARTFGIAGAVLGLIGACLGVVSLLRRRA
jgi:hypothetical protein